MLTLEQQVQVELYGGLPQEITVNAQEGSLWVLTPAVRIHGGDGLPFFIQGGINSGYAQLSHIVRRFARRREHLVICVSQCGAADVSRSPDFYKAVALPLLNIRDIEVLDKFGVGKVIAYGSSIGALESFALAAKYPERVAAVIAVNPAGLIRQWPWRMVWKGLKANREVVEKDFNPPPTLRPSYLDLFRGVFGRIKDIAASDVGLGLLAQVKCPVLIYTGRQDGVFPPQILRKHFLGYRFPNVSVTVMEEFSHTDPDTRRQIHRLATHARSELKKLAVI